MRNSLGLALAAVAVAALAGTAPAATAQPAVTEPVLTPVVADNDTGSAALDFGSAAARSAGVLAGRGDIIGLIVLLGITPIQMFTGGVCDLATQSALPDPCSPMRYPAAAPAGDHAGDGKR